MATYTPIKYPVVEIDGIEYQLTYVATWEFGYSVNGQRYRCESSESINSTWRYLSESTAEMYDGLGILLANS